ncbi:MAG: hypothetical protein EPO24_07355 [Bacteroidetes bacterium]|nr:MAG: hypothetical protein EPO24_07355 [Bacteroidota bacterium]
MKMKILIIATIAIIITLLASSVAHALSKGKPKKPAKSKVKTALLKPVKPLLDSLAWMQAWALTPCADDSLSMTAMSLIREVNQWTKTKYRKGGTSKKGVDCSGFVLNIFKNAFSFPLPRTSREQYTVGETVEKSELKPGDLVFFQSKKKRINHVGIYLGNGQFVHSARKAGVTLSSLASTYYSKYYAGAKRILGLDFAANQIEDNSLLTQ